MTQPAIFLPKGGDVNRDLGEKFAANPVQGTGSMSVPTTARPGRSGFCPQLSRFYDSSSGNGPFGFGWSLSLSSITGKPKKHFPNIGTPTNPMSLSMWNGAKLRKKYSKSKLRP
ncbi:MAG: hypothetical protein E8D43_00040 [Nitrospira sp.]|nr:MAG: hypothetical protein E8D43_00040 [Nitrospira sp.]